MRSIWIWVITIVSAVILGIGAALGVGAIIGRNYLLNRGFGQPFTGVRGYGMGPGGMMGTGGMTRPSFLTGSTSGTRISTDQAIEQVKAYVSRVGADLQVSEIMEFSNNFYAVVKETSSGRGAMELLVDPYSGAVFPEYGPNMMWNSKYSPMGNLGRMMGGSATGDNTITLDQAVQDAQAYLDTNIPGAKLETDGISFYGH